MLGKWGRRAGLSLGRAGRPVGVWASWTPVTGERATLLRTGGGGSEATASPSANLRGSSVKRPPVSSFLPRPDGRCHCVLPSRQSLCFHPGPLRLLLSVGGRGCRGETRRVRALLTALQWTGRTTRLTARELLPVGAVTPLPVPYLHLMAPPVKNDACGEKGGCTFTQGGQESLVEGGILVSQVECWASQLQTGKGPQAGEGLACFAKGEGPGW